MRPSINFKKTLTANIEETVTRLTDSLKESGFGVLTRIDLHTKIKEKTGADLPPTVILGACNPQLALEAVKMNSDIASLLPCNAVVRELGHGQVSVELAKPTAMMEMVGDETLVKLAEGADQRLLQALNRL